MPGPAREHRRLGQAFKGKINWIQLDQGAADHDHLITRRNDCAGMAADELGSIAWRNYLDPVSKTGTDPAEVIFDQAIKFCPSGVSGSTVTP